MVNAEGMRGLGDQGIKALTVVSRRDVLEKLLEGGVLRLPWPVHHGCGLNRHRVHHKLHWLRLRAGYGCRR